MPFYSPKEEKANVISHGLGFLLSLVGTVFLMQLAIEDGSARHVIAFCIFGSSLMILYAASTFYHLEKNPNRRTKLRIVDHASIYVLIAGTYTPFTLITMEGTSGEVFFGISWGIALAGIILKIFFTGRFALISTLMYVLMGGLIFIDVNPLLENLPKQALQLLLFGGISYLVGAIIYSIKSLSFNHAIFHVLVLIGSFCHFLAVYLYVLPD